MSMSLSGREITVSVALRQYIRRMQRSLDHKLDTLSQSVTPAAVHACRTQTRRLRAILRTFRHAFKSAALARYEKILRQLTLDLGSVRSADVEQQIISRVAEDQCIPKEDGLEELRAIAAHTRSRAVSDLKAKMIDEAWPRRLERLRRASSNPSLIVESQQPMGVMIARILRRRRRRLRRQLRAHQRSPRALHKLRLKVKILRYLLERCAPNEATVRAEMKQLRLLQDRLGEFHDEWSLRHRLTRQPRYLRANIDICARLRDRRDELLRSIDKHQNRLLRIWEETPYRRIRVAHTAAVA